MSKFFIVMLFVFNLVCLNQAVATTQIDQGVIYNEESAPEDGKDEEKNPEDECE